MSESPEVLKRVARALDRIEKELRNKDVQYAKLEERTVQLEKKVGLLEVKMEKLRIDLNETNLEHAKYSATHHAVVLTKVQYRSKFFKVLAWLGSSAIAGLSVALSWIGITKN